MVSKKFPSKFGFSLVEVIIAGAMAGGVSLVIAQFAKNSGLFAKHTRDMATLGEIRNQFTVFNANRSTWLAALRANSTIINTCLIPATVPAPQFQCPSAVALPALGATPPAPYDTNLQQATTLFAQSNGTAFISPVDLYDMNSLQIAGAAQPINYDGNGAPCVPTSAIDTRCPRYQAFGYMIRQFQGANVNPGAVSFVRKITPYSTAPTNPGAMVLQATYEEINFGTSWNGAATNDLPVGTILPFAGTVAPSGFLICNGSYVSTLTFPELYAQIGTNWGVLQSVSGVPAFPLPDFRGRFVKAAGGGIAQNTPVNTSTLMSHAHSGTVTAAGASASSAMGSAASGWSINTNVNLTNVFPSPVSGIACTVTGTGLSWLGWFYDSQGGDCAGDLGQGPASPSDPTPNPVLDYSAPYSVNTNFTSSPITAPAGSIALIGSAAQVTVTGVGAATETRPNNAAVIYIIKSDF